MLYNFRLVVGGAPGIEGAADGYFDLAAHDHIPAPSNTSVMTSACCTLDIYGKSQSIQTIKLVRVRRLIGRGTFPCLAHPGG